jgi:hypothetical protein
MEGGNSETFAARSDEGAPTKIYESSLRGDALQQLRAILSAKEVRDIRGSYPPSAGANAYSTEKIAVSILREDGVQNFVFPDTSARQPYDSTLKRLFKWLGTAEQKQGFHDQGSRSKQLLTGSTEGHAAAIERLDSKSSSPCGQQRRGR